MTVRTIEAVSGALLTSHPDRRTYTFYKEGDVWFIDLPNYSHKEHLQMKAGAHKLLTRLSAGKPTVTLTMDTEPFENADTLTLVEFCSAPKGGAIYQMPNVYNKQESLYIWICDLALFVFGDMPPCIYIRKEATSN